MCVWDAWENLECFAKYGKFLTVRWTDTYTMGWCIESSIVILCQLAYILGNRVYRYFCLHQMSHFFFKPCFNSSVVSFVAFNFRNKKRERHLNPWLNPFKIRTTFFGENSICNMNGCERRQLQNSQCTTCIFTFKIDSAWLHLPSDGMF